MRSRAFVLLAVALSAVLTAQQPTTPDLILLNGRIYTVDTARPWAEALAVSGTRISAVGSTSDIKALAGPRTRIIDLKGAFVSPGFC